MKPLPELPHQRSGPAVHRNPCPGRLPLTVWAFICLLILLLPGAAASQAPQDPAPQDGKIIEDLHYRVDVCLWSDAVKTRVTLRELAPGRYRAKAEGETQGFLSTVSGNWRGSYTTEMQYQDGKLLPVLYREHSTSRSKRWYSEYRFDYEKKIVELFKPGKGEELEKKWEGSLQEPMYDPISFYYNQRLALNHLQEGGETLKFKAIPYPRKDDIVVRVGPVSPEGRKIMVELTNRVFGDSRSQIYAFIDGEGIPTKVWTHLLAFGKLTLELLPGGKRLEKGKFAGALEQAVPLRIVQRPQPPAPSLEVEAVCLSPGGWDFLPAPDSWTAELRSSPGP